MPQLPQTLQDIIDTIVMNFVHKELDFGKNAHIAYIAEDKEWVRVEFDVDLAHDYDKYDRKHATVYDYKVARITLNTGEDDINIPLECDDVEYYIDDFYASFSDKYDNVHFACDF